jgi:hypothetical protein
MSAISTGTWGLREAAAAKLAAGIEAQIEAAQVELTSTGSMVELAAVVSTGLRMQAEQPTNLEMPALFLVPVRGAELGGGVSSAGFTNQGPDQFEELDLVAYVSVAQGADGHDQETLGLLLLPVYLAAGLRCLRRPVAQGGVLGLRGITAITKLGDQRTPHRVNNNRVIYAGREHWRLRFEQETTS